MKSTVKHRKFIEVVTVRGGAEGVLGKARKRIKIYNRFDSQELRRRAVLGKARQNIEVQMLRNRLRRH